MIAEVTHKLDSICPESHKFILGDFNHSKLGKTLKTCDQYVTCPTTQKNTMLDLCYGSLRGACKSLPLPSFGASNHGSIRLMPVYKPSFRRLVQEERSVKSWSEAGISSLQACSDSSDWHCFFDAYDDINELSDSISSYITFYVDSVIPSKKKLSLTRIISRGSQKSLNLSLTKRKGFSSRAASWRKRQFPGKLKITSKRPK